MTKDFQIKSTRWTSNVSYGRTSSCRLYFPKNTPENYKWQIAKETNVDLCATIENSILSITPRRNVPSQTSITIYALSKGEIVSELTIEIKIGDHRKKAIALGVCLGLGIPIVAAGVATGVILLTKKDDKKEEEWKLNFTPPATTSITSKVTSGKLSLGSFTLINKDGSYIKNLQSAGTLIPVVNYHGSKSAAFDGNDVDVIAPTSGSKWSLSLDNTKHQILETNNGDYSISLKWTPSESSTPISSPSFNLNVNIVEGQSVINLTPPQSISLTIEHKVGNLDLGTFTLQDGNGNYINTEAAAGTLTPTVTYEGSGTQTFNNIDVTAPTTGNDWTLTSSETITSANNGLYKISVKWTPLGQSEAIESTNYYFTINIPVITLTAPATTSITTAPTGELDLGTFKLQKDGIYITNPLEAGTITPEVIYNGTGTQAFTGTDIIVTNPALGTDWTMKLNTTDHPIANENNGSYTININWIPKDETAPIPSTGYTLTVNIPSGTSEIELKQPEDPSITIADKQGNWDLGTFTLKDGDGNYVTTKEAAGTITPVVTYVGTETQGITADDITIIPPEDGSNEWKLSLNNKSITAINNGDYQISISWNGTSSTPYDLDVDVKFSVVLTKPASITIGRDQTTGTLDLGSFKLVNKDGTYVTTTEAAGTITPTVNYETASGGTTSAIDPSYITVTPPSNGDDWTLSLDTATHNINNVGNGKYTIGIDWTPAQQSKVSATAYYLVVNIVENKIKYKDSSTGETNEYILEDGIDPNIFCTQDTDSQWYTEPRTFNIKGGGQLTIDYSNSTQRKNILSVTIGNIADGITEIGEHFLDGTKNLKSVDFSGLSSIKKLGYDFLDECGLESADMSLLVSVEEIADSFMTDTNNLKSINLSGFESVKTIGNRFLFHVYNENFTTVDLTPLRNVKKIGAGAFMRSYYLTSINTSSIKAEVFDVDGLDSAGKNIYSFASDNNTYPIYTTGVKITGDDASNIKARFPARDEEPYRKWQD